MHLRIGFFIACAHSLIFAAMQYTLKKSMGQHFLKDENICRKIISALEQAIAGTGVTTVLEVGPGAGAITKYILQIPLPYFKAVEIDAEKVDYLETNFPALKEKIIHKSFLDIDAPFEKTFIVIGNFP